MMGIDGASEQGVADFPDSVDWGAKAERERPRIICIVRWPVGGIRTWCRDVYSAPEFDEFDIELILPSGAEAAVLREELAATHVRVTLTDPSLTVFGSIVARRIALGDYQLVHSHGFTSAVLSHWWTSISRTRHLVTPHDVVLDSQYQGLKGRSGRWLIAQVLSRADLVQAVSDAAAANLRSQFPRALRDSHRLAVVPNGIDPLRIGAHSTRHENLRERLEIDERSVIVGFFGRFMSQKGFRYIVAAVAARQRLGESGPPLVVVSVGGGGFHREEKAHIESLGLGRHFRFVDFVPNVSELIKSVDVVAMPSQWEACGLLAMEAMVAGVPVVVSDCDALVDIAAGSPAQVVAKTDAQELLAAILALSGSDAKAAARQYSPIARDRFDIVNTRAGIVDLYRKLTGGQ